MNLVRALLLLAVTMIPVASLAQGFKVGFGNMQQDSSLPVEVTADSLSVNQTDGSAVFSGNVKIIQGDMRMTADQVNVHYHTETRGIAKLVATGDVLLAQGGDVAEAQMAEYSIDDGAVRMSGDVMVLQETNTITADEMVVDLRNNSAQMSGRVKTILRSE